MIAASWNFPATSQPTVINLCILRRWGLRRDYYGWQELALGIDLDLRGPSVTLSVGPWEFSAGRWWRVEGEFRGAPLWLDEEPDEAAMEKIVAAITAREVDCEPEGVVVELTGGDAGGAAEWN